MTVNLQLSLTESEINKIGTIKVEGIINPTNAEMDLKDGVGEEDLFICLLFMTNILDNLQITSWSFQVMPWRKLEAESSWKESRNCAKHKDLWRWHQVHSHVHGAFYKAAECKNYACLLLVGTWKGIH